MANEFQKVLKNLDRLSQGLQRARESAGGQHYLRMLSGTRLSDIHEIKHVLHLKKRDAQSIESHQKFQVLARRLHHHVDAFTATLDMGLGHPEFRNQLESSVKTASSLARLPGGPVVKP